MVAGLGESAKRELHDSAVAKQQHAPEAISGLERDLDDMRLRPQTETEWPRGQEIQNEGGIIDSIKSTASVAAAKASDTAESVKETVIHTGQSAYTTTTNALNVAKDTTANALTVAKDKVLDAGAKAKEMVVAASERSSERKGSVPDASLQLPSSQEAFPLDKGMLDKDRPFEQDKGFNQGFNQGLDAGFNQGLDAGLNKGLDAGLNKGLDAGFNQGIDAGLNPEIDAGLDRTLDKQKDELHRTTEGTAWR